MTTFRNDVRYGFRVLARSRGFVVLAILTMAVGIGIMTTVFSLIHGVLLQPLPWPEPERLVRLSETHQGATRRLPWIMTNAAYLAWRDQPSTIEQLAAWSRRQATITGAGDAERLSYAVATASVFSLLQARPLIGVTFGTEDEAAAMPLGRIILSYGLWQQRFGGNPQVLGQSISLDGRAHTIIGVMPREFAFPDRETRAWTSFYIPPVVTPGGQDRELLMFDAMARLKPAVTPEQAAAEATARARSGPDRGLVAMAIFGSNGPVEIAAVPALQAITADIRRPLIMMLVAVALLLMTAIANVAGLQLSRANTRQREIAIRAAIGASTRRITQQLLAENMLLGLAGGTAGLILTAALHRLLPSRLPADFPRLDNVVLNWSVAWFAIAITVVVGMLLGCLPALHLRRLKLTDALLEHGGASSGIHSRVPQARMAIMVGQIAIACTLLIGAGLFIRSFVAMMNADRGYRAANVLTTRVSMPDGLFTSQRRRELVDALLERARLLPGVTRIAFTTGLPLSGSETLSSFKMKSLRPPIGVEIQVSTTRSVVSEEYFAAMGMRAIEGRTFNSSDTAISPKVVVVSRSFARRYLSDKPIGDR